MHSCCPQNHELNIDTCTERDEDRENNVQTLHENKNTNVRLLNPAAAAAIQFYSDKFMTNLSLHISLPIVQTSC